MCLTVVLWCPAVELDLTSHIRMTCTCHAGQSATNEHSHANSFRCYTSITYSYTRAETGGRGGIVPLKYLGGGTEVLLSPQCLENVIANYPKEIEKGRKRRYDTSDRHTNLFYRPIDLYGGTYLNIVSID